MRTKILLRSALVLAGLAAMPSQAMTNIRAASQGWINQSGTANGNTFRNNYSVGNCGNFNCSGGEYRDFFDFVIPILPNSPTSAKVLIYSGEIDAYQAPEITYTITSTLIHDFSGLGTGTVFGSRTYTKADQGQIRNIVLNSAAIEAIGGGGFTFEISGRLTSPTIFDPNGLDQIVLGSSGGFYPVLVLDPVPFTTVPEPAGWAFLLIGLGSVGIAMRSSRRRVATIMQVTI